MLYNRQYPLLEKPLIIDQKSTVILWKGNPSTLVFDLHYVFNEEELLSLKEIEIPGITILSADTAGIFSIIKNYTYYSSTIILEIENSEYPTEEVLDLSKIKLIFDNPAYNIESNFTQLNAVVKNRNEGPLSTNGASTSDSYPLCCNEDILIKKIWTSDEGILKTLEFDGKPASSWINQTLKENDIITVKSTEAADVPNTALINIDYETMKGEQYTYSFTMNLKWKDQQASILKLIQGVKP